MGVLRREQWQHLVHATAWSTLFGDGVRNGSPLHHPDWSRYNDPAGIVYHKYSALQGQQESFVQGLFDQMSERGHDAMLQGEWVARLARLYTPLRFPFQALKMMSAHLMVSGPAEPVSNCAAYQTGDHIRWLDHIAYRTAELAQTFRDMGFGVNERTIWETDPAWQPLRELIERAMAVHDWGESFVVLNLVVKPCVEEGIMTSLADAGRRSGDTIMDLLTNSQLGDARRHKDWARALVAMAQEEKRNHTVLQEWLNQWMPLANRAIETYCVELPDGETLATRGRVFIGSFHASMGFGKSRF